MRSVAARAVRASWRSGVVVCPSPDSFIKSATALHDAWLKLDRVRLKFMECELLSPIVSYLLTMPVCPGALCSRLKRLSISTLPGIMCMCLWILILILAILLFVWFVVLVFIMFLPTGRDFPCTLGIVNHTLRIVCDSILITNATNESMLD